MPCVGVSSTGVACQRGQGPLSVMYGRMVLGVTCFCRKKNSHFFYLRKNANNWWIDQVTPCLHLTSSLYHTGRLACYYYSAPSPRTPSPPLHPPQLQTQPQPQRFRLLAPPRPASALLSTTNKGFGAWAADVRTGPCMPPGPFSPSSGTSISSPPPWTSAACGVPACTRIHH